MRVIKATYSKNYKGELRNSVYCNECGNENASHVLEVGDTPDYESKTARLCYDCITKAYEVAQAQMPKKLSVKANINLMRGSENDEGID